MNYFQITFSIKLCKSIKASQIKNSRFLKKLFKLCAKRTNDRKLPEIKAFYQTFYKQDKQALLMWKYAIFPVIPGRRLTYVCVCPRAFVRVCPVRHSQL